jgi:hypothetical protein
MSLYHFGRVTKKPVRRSLNRRTGLSSQFCRQARESPELFLWCLRRSASIPTEMPAAAQASVDGSGTNVPSSSLTIQGWSSWLGLTP